MTVFDVKEHDVLDTPLFLFDCTFLDGSTYHWASHHSTVDGVEYLARVVRTNAFEMQASSEGGVDTIPKISFELANADGVMSELQRNTGFKGATLVVPFVFYDLAAKSSTTQAIPIFRGILDAPETITEQSLRVSAVNRLSLQRITLPPMRVQKRCPWQFPTTLEERQEAVQGGVKGAMSRFYRCGYSPDVNSGCGNLNQAVPFTSCDYSRAQCEQRGMFATDMSGRTTARFGGIEYVPPVIAVRAAGDKNTQLSVVQDNEARYNDYVPMVYGTAWFRPSIVFARNDGNLTHFEILLGTGMMNRVLTVLVNEIEIPAGRAATNMTGTGWFNVVTYGTRNGVFNHDFADAAGHPLGDPYGSMAYMQLVVPNSINDGRSTPAIQVLMEGLQIEQFGSDGSSLGASFCNNPVWVILDLLRRSGWGLDEIDLRSFAQAAGYCDEPIATIDLNGNTTSTKRFQCNLVLQNKRSAGDVIRGIRNGSRLYLAYSTAGLLRMMIENTLALQQPQLPQGSNASNLLNGGWPAYEFGDGINGTTGIARASDSSSTFKITSRGSADTPNRFSVEFQDGFNSYQQDSVALVHADDVRSCGYEVCASPAALGIPNYSQAERIVALCLNKSVEGNTYVQFQTSVRALGIQPGDIVAISHSREGFDRTPFRVTKVSPGANFRRAWIYAQIHDDGWYTDAGFGQAGNALGHRSYRIGVPRAIVGTSADGQFAIAETVSVQEDATVALTATVDFIAPAAVAVNAPGCPLVSLTANISSTGGTLAGNSNWYYGLTSVDADGNESPVSFCVAAGTGEGVATYSVSLSDLSFPPAARTFNVYRGPSPAELLCISKGNSLASSFTDNGLPLLRVLPPDSSYDHANFYWRTELVAPSLITTHSSTTAGSSSLNLQSDQYSGMTLRIASGKGAGQERLISTNDTSIFTVSPAWTIEPDSTSSLVVVETAYRFGASSSGTPVQFAVPNQPGTVIHICGRSANVYDVESAYELSTVTRWQLQGGGAHRMDADVPAAPVFGLSVLPEGGGLSLGSIGFESLENTSTVSLGTITVYYRDEGSADAPPALGQEITASDASIILSLARSFSFPQYFIVDQEIVKATGLTPDNAGLVIVRGVHASTATAHQAQAVVYPLEQLTDTFPFLSDFFSTTASDNWTQTIILSNARVCSAEFFVTNSRGNSPTAAGCFTALVGGGLRTLSGGQAILQVPGPLAVINGAVPPLDPGAVYAVRDVYAYVGTAPANVTDISLQVTIDGQLYCPLTIRAGTLQSLSVDGSTLPPLRAGQKLGLNILAVGEETPGSDLTVVIRV
jgi:hypothetical protein